MGVKSAFTGFFTHRLVVSCSIPITIGIAMPAIFFFASSFTELSDLDLRAKHVNLIVREIGHRLLLQAGDSTSRVLPVTETKEGTFLLQFENEFVFSHDSLMVLSQSLLPKAEFPSGYTVTVHDCRNTDIVYGFQVYNSSPDLLPCRGRREPLGCYTVEFAFPDFERNAENGMAENEKGKKADHVNIDLKKADVERRIADSEKKKAEINQLTEELKSARVDHQVAKPKLEELKTKPTRFDYPLSILVLLGVTLLIGRLGRSLTPLPVQTQYQAVVKPTAPVLPALGKFLFDVKGHRLLLGSEVISLTDKESRILDLLNESFGELISRETLIQKIWIDEGVITGRSLDMFVSKLRKKLSSDPDLRITNVHGKGYRLEIPCEQQMPPIPVV
jgi:DNA-binding winged helix-turn-helix (wHTH) protein